LNYIKFSIHVGVCICIAEGYGMAYTNPIGKLRIKFSVHVGVAFVLQRVIVWLY
jgi:hypothetical protein